MFCEKEAHILAKYYFDFYLFNGFSIGVFEKESGKLIGLAMSTIHKDKRLNRVPKEHTLSQSAASHRKGSLQQQER